MIKLNDNKGGREMAAKEEFKVGDVIDSQGHSNMIGKSTKRRN